MVVLLFTKLVLLFATVVLSFANVRPSPGYKDTERRAHGTMRSFGDNGWYLTWATSSYWVRSGGTREKAKWWTFSRKVFTSWRAIRAATTPGTRCSSERRNLF